MPVDGIGTVRLSTMMIELDAGFVDAGFVDMLLWHIWRCMDMYDQGPKLGMRRKRNCAEDSATVKGKRPDFFLLSSRALLFKGEDKTSEADLQQALEELSTKLKDWGAAVHGKVCRLTHPMAMHNAAWSVFACNDMQNTMYVLNFGCTCSTQHLCFCLSVCRWNTFCAMLALAPSSRCAPCN